MVYDSWFETDCWKSCFRWWCVSEKKRRAEILNDDEPRGAEVFNRDAFSRQVWAKCIWFENSKSQTQQSSFSLTLPRQTELAQSQMRRWRECTKADSYHEAAAAALLKKWRKEKRAKDDIVEENEARWHGRRSFRSRYKSGATREKEVRITE